MVALDEDLTKRWCMGQAIAIDKDLSTSQYARMYSPDQEFLGVSEVNEVGLQPIVVLNPIN
jgi:hypothetical protein